MYIIYTESVSIVDLKLNCAAACALCYIAIVYRYIPQRLSHNLRIAGKSI